MRGLVARAAIRLAKRCLAITFAGVVGYLTMLRPTGAHSPYIIMTVNCVWVAVAAFIAMKAEFRWVNVENDAIGPGLQDLSGFWLPSAAAAFIAMKAEFRWVASCVSAQCCCCGCSCYPHKVKCMWSGCKQARLLMQSFHECPGATA